MEYVGKDQGGKNMEKILVLLRQVREDVDFSTSDDFIRDNLLDSLGVMTLVDVLEEAFDITIDNDDIVYDNFKNVDAILTLIGKYK